MAKSSIRIIPTDYTELMALLNSDVLRAVEEPLAARMGLKLLRDYISSTANFTQAEMSVSGMTVKEIESFLSKHRDDLIRFWLRYFNDQRGQSNEHEEYPAGEEQEPPGQGKCLGLSVGHGITVAIYYNFLANRPENELHEFLKNRRIPHQKKYASDMRRAFERSSLPDSV